MHTLQRRPTLRRRAIDGGAWLPVLLLALLLASCAGPTGLRLPTPDLADPGAALQPLAQQHRVCGVAVAVIRQRELHSLSAASGCTPALPVQPDSVFQAASLGKPVFAYAVLKLVQQGQLALDAPVLQYLPQGYRHAHDPLQPGRAGREDPVTDPRLAAVTVRMLLQHTAGLPNWARGPLHFQATPGAGWAYSGEGYVLLQRAVEAVTQQPLDQVMQQWVFGPLGMAHSSYRWTPQIGQRLLSGTRADGTPRGSFPLQQPVAAFSLYTSAADYARFLVALLHDQALLATTMATPVQVDPALQLGWGLGWGLAQASDGPHLWQWGNNPGYRALALLHPGRGDAVVVLTNSDAGLRLAQPLVRATLPGDHQVFRFASLREGLLERLCRALRLCA